jgi:hypothetical protein
MLGIVRGDTTATVPKSGAKKSTATKAASKKATPKARGR